MLTVIGEALIDLVASAAPGAESTFTAHPGGSPLNVAVGAARLGIDTELLARVAGDAFGRLLRNHARRNEVGLTAAVNASEPSTLAVVSLNPDGSAAYDFYIEGTADWQWSPAELVIPARTDILHFGSLASWTAPGQGPIRDAVREAADRVLVSYDPNVRPHLIGDPAHGRDLVEQNIALAHVVKASDEDAGWLYPDLPMADIAARWLASGPGLVVVTRGPEGAVAYRTGHEPIERPARRVKVVDTVGAGDSSMGGLLAGLDRLGVRNGKQLLDLPDDPLSALLDDALLVASLTCGRAGADPPTRAELDAAR